MTQNNNKNIQQTGPGTKQKANNKLIAGTHHKI